MKSNLLPEVCSGTYFPLRGRPKRNYYVVLEEDVLAGPFKTQRAATKQLAALGLLDIETPAAPPLLKQLDPKAARRLAAELRRQEKALSAARNAAS